MRTILRSDYSAEGRVVRGRLLVDRRELEAALAEFPDGDVVITVRRAKRSPRANAFYWSIVLPAIANYTGYDKDETHEAMKALLVPKHLSFCDGNGEIHGSIVVGASTKNMTIGEFYDYTERVRDFAAHELGLSIRGPDPNWRELDKGE